MTVLKPNSSWSKEFTILNLQDMVSSLGFTDQEWVAPEWWCFFLQIPAPGNSESTFNAIVLKGRKQTAFKERLWVSCSTGSNSFLMPPSPDNWDATWITSKAVPDRPIIWAPVFRPSLWKLYAFVREEEKFLPQPVLGNGTAGDPLLRRTESHYLIGVEVFEQPFAPTVLFPFFFPISNKQKRLTCIQGKSKDKGSLVIEFCRTNLAH